MRTISILAMLGGILGVVATHASCYSTNCERTETCPSLFSEQVPDTDAEGGPSEKIYMVSTLAGTGEAGGWDGPGSEATFYYPYGIAIGPDGILYVADTFNNRIRKIAADGEVSTLAGTGDEGLTNGPCATATFNSPRGIDVDAAGNIYVADDFNNAIRKITPSPTCQVITLAGAGPDNPGAGDSWGTFATFYSPAGLTVDALGNVYVADTNNNKIREVTSEGKVTTIAGTGIPDHIDGSTLSSTFYGPTGIVVDATGTLYVADCINNNIRKIMTNGEVITLAGSGAAGLIDSTGADAAFNIPVGITIDANGNLFVSDTFNNVVRKVTPDGVVTTIAGQREAYTNKGVMGDTDGPSDTATFNSLSGVAVDTNGVIYVADTGNNKIRKIAPVPQ
ncbi:MAG: NHL repeat-containing protein [Polyangiaceae bacterium]|nr:NHL repeat-containing protein [Polyangiaceae bacterium]